MRVTTPAMVIVVPIMRIQLMGLWICGCGRSGVWRVSQLRTCSAVCAL